MALLTPPKPVPWWRLPRIKKFYFFFLFNQSLAHKSRDSCTPFPWIKLLFFLSLPLETPSSLSFFFFSGKKKIRKKLGQKGGWLKRRSNTPPRVNQLSRSIVFLSSPPLLLFFIICGGVDKNQEKRCNLFAPRRKLPLACPSQKTNK